MIILINGTYGVGKSSVSKEIQRQIENGKVRLFDPDGFYQDIKKEIFYDIILNGGGVNPQNNISFLNRVKKELKVFTNKEIMCIVPMAVTTKESLEIIWKYLYTNEKEFCHFILDADESAITERIVSDIERKQKELALDELHSNVIFLKSNFEDAIRIDTNHKKVEEVAHEIIHIIKLKYFMK